MPGLMTAIAAPLACTVVCFPVNVCPGRGLEIPSLERFASYPAIVVRTIDRVKLHRVSRLHQEWLGA